jgi:hypothetical protein
VKDERKEMVDDLQSLLTDLSKIVLEHDDETLQLLHLSIVDIGDGRDLCVDPFDDERLGLHPKDGDLSLHILRDLLLEHGNSGQSRHLDKLVDLLELLPEHLSHLWVSHSELEASQEVHYESDHGD